MTPGQTSALVTFAAPADDGNSEILGYAVQVISGGEVQRTITGIGPDQNSVEVTGLAPGTAYRFRVLAINRMGSSPVSEVSDPVEVTGEPAPPGNEPAPPGNEAGAAGERAGAAGERAGAAGEPAGRGRSRHRAGRRWSQPDGRHLRTHRR